jgi:hypothetical protein
LVREAQMLGKARRQDRLASLTQYSDIREQLTRGVKAHQLQQDPTFRTPKSPIDGFFGNETKDN